MRKLYPGHTVVASQTAAASILDYPAAYVQSLRPDLMISQNIFVPFARRMGTPGILVEAVSYGCFQVSWEVRSIFTDAKRWLNLLQKYLFKLFIVKVGFPCLPSQATTNKISSTCTVSTSFHSSSLFMRGRPSNPAKTCSSLREVGPMPCTTKYGCSIKDSGTRTRDCGRWFRRQIGKTLFSMRNSRRHFRGMCLASLLPNVSIWTSRSHGRYCFPRMFW